jgi:hypothetical protein
MMPASWLHAQPEFPVQYCGTYCFVSGYLLQSAACSRNAAALQQAYISIWVCRAHWVMLSTRCLKSTRPHAGATGATHGNVGAARPSSPPAAAPAVLAGARLTPVAATGTSRALVGITAADVFFAGAVAVPAEEARRGHVPR